ncbi:small conductance mechanosensitive channel [Salimicrobium halophilum]|uniref:Small conductance mechanosensitive channel n=2 Tax=Salimicrobium halophilum TaxID=86666 RepID=A0A1G8UR03_9BACI|nr:small conductance mechanosensitive channel [Salimicrobium halophilum]
MSGYGRVLLSSSTEEATKEAIGMFEEWKDAVLGPELWSQIGLVAFKIFFILILAGVIIKVGNKVIDRFYSRRVKGPFRISERRETTLTKLTKNTLTYIVYFTAFVMILEAFDINIGALLAGAGIAGLAIGFGAQNLVRDIISGFFIIFEDQFSVGDFIGTAGVEGFVIEIGLRTSKVKSWGGEIHIIPNGNITQVTNYSVDNSAAIVDVSVAYESDIEKAEQVILELLKELEERYEEIVAPPELLGIVSLGASDISMRIFAETLPMEHWNIGRVIRKEVKLRLDQEGIEIPFPRIVMYSREEAGGAENGEGIRTE